MELKLIELSQGPVSYRVIGNGARKIIFYHGFPGSSSQVAMFASAAKTLDVQILCFDRPGYNKTLWSTTDMLSQTVKISDEITTALNWTKLEVVTVSGGTPYGIMFAVNFPDKVTGVRVICGLGYLQNASVKKYFKNTQLFSLNYLRLVPGALLKQILNRPKSIKTQRNPVFEFFYPTSSSDRNVISKRNLDDALNFTLIEAVAQNAAGPLADSRVFLSDWGKDLENFKVPIHFWHGGDDLVIPFKVSEMMASLIPHAGFTLVPGEGHVSLPVNRATEILNFQLGREAV